MIVRRTLFRSTSSSKEYLLYGDPVRNVSKLLDFLSGSDAWYGENAGYYDDETNLIHSTLPVTVQDGRAAPGA